MKQELSLPEGAPDLRLSTSSYGSHLNELHSNPWQHLTSYPQSASQNTRPSWDQSIYINSNPVTSVTAAQQSVPYDRNISESTLGAEGQKSQEGPPSQQMPSS